MSEKMTKAEAVRQAIAAGADKPTEGVKFIKEKFGLTVTPAAFSANKSQSKTRKPSPHTQPDGEDLVVVLQNLKGLVKRHGADQVKRLADALAE